MTKVLVEFDSIEQAQVAINAVNSPVNAGYAVAPQVAPAPQAPQVNYAPQPQAPAPQQYAAPAPQAPAPQAPVAAPATAPATLGAPVGADGSNGITAAQLGAAAQAYSKAYKAAGTKAVFAQFGIASIGQAHPSQYPALLNALTVR